MNVRVVLLSALSACLLFSGQPICAATADSGARPVVGLVLSGGGARGFAHIGALKALEELHIPVDVLAATSMGAMVGGGYAAGYDADAIGEITLSVDWTRMFALRADRELLRWKAKEDDRRGLSSTELALSGDGVLLPKEMVPAQELDIFLGRVTQPVSGLRDLSRLSIPFAALATNLETGERVVLQKDVTLAVAMRASMSIPGAYAPVEHAGKLLVDGGLVDNLPIGQARSMGADVVIAINVGTPLNKRDKLNNIMGIMGQMVNLLTEQSVIASIESLHDEDIYIQPDLKEFTSGDFSSSADIIDLGYQAVMNAREQLQRFSVSEPEYARWKQARQLALVDNPTHRIEQVQVRGLKTVNPERVIDDIDIAPGKTVSSEQVAESARKLWATGDFQSVPFHFEPGPNSTEVLVFEPTEKHGGYSSLRLGGNMQTDFQSANTFNVLVAHTWGWLNRWGAQWRNEIQVGEVKRLSSQWFQPLGEASHWFVMPEVSYQWEPFDVYWPDRDEPIASLRNETFDAHLSLGTDIERSARALVKAGWLNNHTVQEVGVFDVNAKAHGFYVGAELMYDTLDSANFPRKGWSFSAQVMRTLHPHITQMQSIDEVMYSIEGHVPVPLGERTTALLTARTARGGLMGNYQLGGVFNLSGSAYGRYSGNHTDLARVMLYHDVSGKMREMRMPLYVGASFEMGRAWDTDSAVSGWNDDKSWRRAASLFIASDSWIGPLYLVAGRTFDHGNAITLYWGRLH